MSQGSYICQRAAEAIIAEIGPLRLSNDALQAINSFLDEFLAILVLTAAQLDLVRIKSAVIQLLPQHSLGKNALVEAELELKQQLEASAATDNYSHQTQPQHDFSSYEKMRSLTIGPNSSNLEASNVIPLVQRACASHSALNLERTAGRNNTKSNLKSTYSVDGTIVIAPVVTIYVTAIIEHIAEYLLNAVALTADRVDANYIKVKEVLHTLLQDPQVDNLFRRMNLKETLEKKLVSYQNSYINSLPSPAPSPVAGKKEQILQRRHTNASNKDFQSNLIDNTSNMYEHQRDDNELDYLTTQSSTTCSIRSSESISDRPLSIISSSTTKSSNSGSTTKSRFNIFGSNNASNTTSDRKKTKEKRNTTISLGLSSVGAKRNSSSSSRTKKKKDSARTSSSSEALDPVTPPPVPTLNAFSDFDDLLKSGDTKKVSLTPNRLRSIEVRDTTTAPTMVDNASSEDEQDILQRSNRDVRINSNTSSIARSSSSTSSTITAAKKKRSTDYLSTHPPNSTSSSSLPLPPIPPLPRLSRDQLNNPQSQYLSNNFNTSINNHSPPLTPASSLVSRQQSLRSGCSVSNPQAFDDGRQHQTQRQLQQPHQSASSCASSIISVSSSMDSSLKSSSTHEETSQRGNALSEFSPLSAISQHPHPILRRTSERIPGSGILNTTGSGANNNNRRNVVISQSNNCHSSIDSISTVQTLKPSSPTYYYERPSSNVIKRASMGSRPPSFHESMFDMASGGRSASAMLLGISATNNNLHSLLKDEIAVDEGAQKTCSIKDLRKSSSSSKVVEATLVSNFDEAKQQQQQEMIYVLPPSSSMSYNSLPSSIDQRSCQPTTTLPLQPPTAQQEKFKIPRKSVSNSRFFDASTVPFTTITNRGIDQACQTDPDLDFINTDTYTNNDDEEWFLDVQNDDTDIEDERLAVEWLLGCA